MLGIGRKIPPLSHAVWNSNYLVEGGSSPLGLEFISKIRDDPSLYLSIQGPQNPTKPYLFFGKSTTKYAIPGVLPEREMPPEFDEESPRSLVRYDIFKILEPELEIRLICCLSLVWYLNMIIQHPYNLNLHILKYYKTMLVKHIFYQAIELKSLKIVF